MGLFDGLEGKDPSTIDFAALQKKSLEHQSNESGLTEAEISAAQEGEAGLVSSRELQRRKGTGTRLDMLRQRP